MRVASRKRDARCGVVLEAHSVGIDFLLTWRLLLISALSLLLDAHGAQAAASEGTRPSVVVVRRRRGNAATIARLRASMRAQR